MTSDQLIDQLFDRMDKWRYLPSYQLERRADIFFSIYLPDIIKGRFNEEVGFLIPEFPVRLGTILPKGEQTNPNLSYKIDYVAVCKSSKKVYFIELKTDDGSRRDKQDKYLEMAKAANINQLIDGILEICKVTKSKKYDNLLKEFKKIGWIDFLDENISSDYEIQIVYIQPNADEKDKLIITFLEVIEYLSEKKDHLTHRFIKSLKEWVNNPGM